MEEAKELFSRCLYPLPVPVVDWHATDLPQALRKFKALSGLMFTEPLVDKEEEVKVKYLLIWAGKEAIELISTWNLSAYEPY